MAAEEMSLALVGERSYNDHQMDLIRKTVAAGTSPLEFDLFIEVCRRTGLDPFARQIYAIKRGDKLTIQTGIDGYRLLAARTGELAGIDDAVYDREDDEHPWKASVTVWRFVRDQPRPFTATARWSEYVQMYQNKPSGLWGKMPYLMLAKCAEALALRKAFPAELSGVYTQDEMDQADTTPLSAPGQPQRQASVQTAVQALPTLQELAKRATRLGITPKQWDGIRKKYGADVQAIQAGLDDYEAKHAKAAAPAVEPDYTFTVEAATPDSLESLDVPEVRI